MFVHVLVFGFYSFALLFFNCFFILMLQYCLSCLFFKSTSIFLFFLFTIFCSSFPPSLFSSLFLSFLTSFHPFFLSFNLFSLFFSSLLPPFPNIVFSFLLCLSFVQPFLYSIPLVFFLLLIQSTSFSFSGPSSLLTTFFSLLSFHLISSLPSFTTSFLFLLRVFLYFLLSSSCTSPLSSFP